MSPTGGRGRIVMTLSRAVDRFVKERHLGEVFPAETGFRSSPSRLQTFFSRNRLKSVMQPG